MAYLGRNPAVGTQKMLDSLESQFNGTLVSFDLRYGGVPTYPTLSAGLLVSIGGVLQEPSEAYYVSSDKIVLSEAPVAGTECWILLYSEFGAAQSGAGEAAIAATGEPMGFENRPHSTISFASNTRTFSIAPNTAAGHSSYAVWTKGTRRTYSVAQSVQIGTTTGLYYIYFDAFGALQSKTTYFTWDTETPVAYVYWNATTSSAPFVADERHGIVLDWATHEYLHRTRGAVIAEGFSISAYTTTGNGNADAHAQFDLGNGTFFDEDLEVAISHSATPTVGTFTQVLTGAAELPVFYLSGSSGAWVRDTPTEYACKQSATTLQYNLLTGSTWSTTPATNNRYVVSWVVATNDITAPIIAILGQEQYTAIGSAEATRFGDLVLTNFPIVEFRPLWKVIFQTSTSFTNAPNALVANVLDLRQLSETGEAGTVVSDHGLMSGLADDDHSQYLHTTLDRAEISANISTTGAISAASLSTGASGVGVNIDNAGLISGPATITLDPAAVGDDTGLVRIKGGLEVLGTTTTIASTTLTVADKNIVIGQGGSTLSSIDTAGIDFGSTAVRLRYNYNSGTNSGLSIEGANVGIGTTNPSSKLDVVGSIIASGSVSAAGTSGFYSTTFAVNARNPIWRFANSDGYGLSYFQGSAGVSPVAGGDTLGFHFGTPTAAASLLQLNNDSGAVVNGTLKATGEIYGSGVVRTNSGRLVLRDDSIEEHFTNGDGAAIGINYFGYANGTTRFRDFFVANGKNAFILKAVGSSGNVGIGTTDPQTKLDVAGVLRAEKYQGINSLVLNSYQTINPSSNVFLYSQPNDRDSWIYLDSADTGSNWGIYHRQLDSAVADLPGNSIGFVGGGATAVQSYISLQTGNAYFRGNVGIGTTNPSYKFEISESEYSRLTLLQSTTGRRWQVGNDGVNFYVYNETNAVRAFNITSTGNVGIGIINPGARFEISGTTADQFAAILSNPNNRVRGDYQRGFGTAHPVAIIGNNDDGTDGENGTLALCSGDLTPTSGQYCGVLEFMAPESGKSNANASMKSLITGGLEGSGGSVGGLGGNIQFWTKGDNATGVPTERLRVTASGNVGIGTTDPDRTLSVNGPARIGGGTDYGTTDVLSVAPGSVNFDANGVTGGRFRITSTGLVGINQPTPTLRFSISEVGADITGGQAIFGTNMKGILLENSLNDNSSLGLWMSTGSHRAGISMQRSSYASTWGTDLRFYTHDDSSTNLTYAYERLRIGPNGNVGIGTTNPGVPLDVRGTDSLIRASETGSGLGWRARIISQNSDAAVNKAAFLGVYGASAGVFAHSSALNAWAPLFVNTTNGSSDGDTVILAGSGSVGIGTVNPQRRLHIYSSGPLRLSDPNREWDFNLKDGKLVIGDNTGSADRFTIDTAGNVGIGTTAPGHKLEVSGRSNFSDNMKITPSSESWAEGLQFYMPTVGTWGGVRWVRNRTNFHGSWYQGWTSLDSSNDMVFGHNASGTQVDNILRLYASASGSALIGRDLYISGHTGGNYANRLVVGGTDTVFTAQDSNLRPTIQATGQYPVLSLNNTVTSNSNHGPTLQFTCNGVGHQFVIGTTGNGSRMDIGFSSAGDWNPHNGISNYQGTTSMSFATDGNVGIGTLSPTSKLHVNGSLSKTSGSFKIDHPIPEKSETHYLVHSFVESPQANNIYRGKVTLTDGSATVNLDEVSRLTEGTFVLLNRDIHCFTSNETDWDNVKGSVNENILTITCQNPGSTAVVTWLVIGERHDQHMYDTDWTDENGRVITEPLRGNSEP